MPEAVDVGSVLGGRYKVTAYVLASAEKDLVLDGMDQVLNRQVSILVASSGNGTRVASSARELATGERPGSIQVLDLAITDDATYLVTNRASAADLLDLIVQQEPVQPEPVYTEPFFTDTLGSEIFGVARSTDPEDDDEEEGEEPERRSRLSGFSKRFSRQAGANEDTAPNSVNQPKREGPRSPANGSSPAPRTVPAPPSGPPRAVPGTEAPDGISPAASGVQGNSAKVTRLPDEDSPHGTRLPAAGVPAGAVLAGGAAAAVSRHPERAASHFPAGANDQRWDSDDDSPDTDDTYDDTAYDTDPGVYDDDSDDSKSRKFSRILVGAVLTLVLVAAVFLAATQLGNFSSDVAGPAGPTPTEPQATAEATSAQPSASPEPVPDAVAPVATGVTRFVPNNPALDAPNDTNLPLIIDGNPATFWGSYVYANEVFGGLAQSLALVVELEEESTISQVDITQLNGSGGSFSVLINDEPTLTGAEQIAQGGFTAPTVSLPVPAGSDGPPTAQYVIINFTQLPRLSNIQAQFPWGLRIAEISVS
ncbi:hypothetical protein [Arthrobacter sp. Br18]|uniref:hypothetical protein n=1 Tax=Arthrobacter sp. Br18 TaxID=1312954 RepID=UPI0012DF1FD9|nr:hypothetical protein [Arthrobacter sp. Br18]